MVDAQTHHGIYSTCAEYAYLLDHGRASEAVDLFSDDAVLDQAAGILRGREEIARWLEHWQADSGSTTRHLVLNLYLEPLAEDQVHGTVLMMLMRRRSPDESQAFWHLSDVRDTYRRDGRGRWQIASRQVHEVFRGPI